MSLVHIQASPKQLSKLRNGRKVRIRAPKPSEGEGFNLYVHPDRYSVINQTFNKGLGMEIQLTPEEILGNRQISIEKSLQAPSRPPTPPTETPCLNSTEGYLKLPEAALKCLKLTEIKLKS